MEHIGVITAAGQEPSADKSKLLFKLHMDNPKYTYTLFDDSQKKFAEENIGKTIKAIYEMSPDGKHRNVESLELATEAQVVSHNGKDEAIAAQVAAKIIKDLWVIGTIPPDDPLCVALRAWCIHCLPAVSSIDKTPKSTKAPIYKDKEGDDVSKATLSQIDALKKMLGITDDDNFTNAIRGRFGDEALQIKDLSKNEAGDWITELQKGD